ncbi:AAA domain-containing protein [Xylaria acuta]|nr:AAA domain-containing protein [Xylaria acuta]
MSPYAFAGLIELVALAVRSSDLALGILLGCFEPESTRLLEGVDGLIINKFKHNSIGIAPDRIGEAGEHAEERADLLALKLDPKQIDGNAVVEATFRIDSPSGTPERSSHVRKVTEDFRPYTLDAMAGMEIYSNRKILKEAEEKVKNRRLAFTTCIGAGIGLLRNQTFVVVIIDGFQGREADIVVFVTTRCNASCEIGLLKDLRRMNVALTRAKARLIVIGNRETLTQGTADPDGAVMWKRLLSSPVVVDVG